MITIKEFVEDCARLIKEKKRFTSYWFLGGTGTIFRDGVNSETEVMVDKIVDGLWKNPKVYPMYIVTGLNGQFSLREKSQVSDMLYDLVCEEKRDD